MREQEQPKITITNANGDENPYAKFISTGTSTSTSVSSTFVSSIYGKSKTTIEDEEEKIEKETDVKSVQPGEYITVVCPLCESYIDVAVVERFVPSKDSHTPEQVVIAYKTKTCDCPEIVLRKFNKAN